MSRVGKHPVKIPSGVAVTRNGDILTFKGKLGEDSLKVPGCVDVAMQGAEISVVPNDSTKFASAMWGTVQRMISNIVKGLTDGFTVSLDLVGVGYKAAVVGRKLVLQLGYSHDIEYEIPEGVTIKCEKPTSIAITSYSKQQVGEIAAVLRSYRKPEPYKGKGVIRAGEFVVRKEGKKK
ncbi:MAG: 50S ribosomal protein L6 [Holosporales bacterium]|jgi:large subunit ribosomal protein L6|nr:50S ribosomal protein L6 [Holosporales bacterium]